MEYRYIGHGAYVMGVPARDLDAADVLEVMEREGIGALEIEASGLYEPARWQEVAPFCGSMRDGRRCWRPVAEWGERCEEHEMREITTTKGAEKRPRRARKTAAEGAKIGGDR
jgi:hypothetical protein